MDNQQNQEQVNAPSLYAMACPKCQSKDYKIIGVKNSKAAVGAAFGAIGVLVASAVSSDDKKLEPTRYKCNSCRKKFEAKPLKAKPEEILAEPFTVNFERRSSFVGAAVKYDVWINGIKIGSVGNGKTFSFEVLTKHNIMYVTDAYGKAFKGHYQFEASNGGKIDVKFKGKFL